MLVESLQEYKNILFNLCKLLLRRHCIGIELSYTISILITSRNDSANFFNYYSEIRVTISNFDLEWQVLAILCCGLLRWCKCLVRKIWLANTSFRWSNTNFVSERWFKMFWGSNWQILLLRRFIETYHTVIDLGKRILEDLGKIFCVTWKMLNCFYRVCMSQMVFCWIWVELRFGMDAVPLILDC